VCGQAAKPARVAHGGGSVSRRGLLGAAAAALPILVTGCKGVQSLGTPPPPAPNIRTLRNAIADEQVLVAAYTTMLSLLGTQDISLAATIRSVHADHVAHLMQLKSRLIVPAGSALALSPSPTPSASVSLTGGVTAEVIALEQAEQAASDRLIEQLTVLPPPLAQLFASIAASEATHVPYLQAARRGR
jgi:hypothetical protein